MKRGRALAGPLRQAQPPGARSERRAESVKACNEGLLDFRRGRSVTVAGTPEAGAVIARARELIEFARRQGYRPDELIKLIERLA